MIKYIFNEFKLIICSVNLFDSDSNGSYLMVLIKFLTD